MSNQKGNFLIPIGVIFLVIIVGVAVYYLGIQERNQTAPQTVSNNQAINNSQPTTSPFNNTEISNWKTYTNNKYQFSFKYPSEWTYADSSELALGQDSERRKGGYHLLLGDPNNTVSAGGGKTIIAGSISINIYNKDNYAFFSEDLSDYHKDGKAKTINVTGLDIQEVHHTACPTNEDCISVIFKKGGNVFNFDTWVWSERYNDLDIIYKTISTLKFTN